jgi:hypothetical protein
MLHTEETILKSFDINSVQIVEGECMKFCKENDWFHVVTWPPNLSMLSLAQKDQYFMIVDKMLTTFSP